MTFSLSNRCMVETGAPWLKVSGYEIRGVERTSFPPPGLARDRTCWVACSAQLQNVTKLARVWVGRACRTSHALIQSMYRIPLRETSTQNILSKSGKSSYGEERVMKQQKGPVCPVEMTLSIVGGRWKLPIVYRLL